jgi:hypothetical protein
MGGNPGYQGNPGCSQVPQHVTMARARKLADNPKRSKGIRGRSGTSVNDGRRHAAPGRGLNWYSEYYRYSGLLVKPLKVADRVRLLLRTRELRCAHQRPTGKPVRRRTANEQARLCKRVRGCAWQRIPRRHGIPRRQRILRRHGIPRRHGAPTRHRIAPRSTA